MRSWKLQNEQTEWNADGMKWLTEVSLNGVDNVRKLISVESWADVGLARLNAKPNVI